MPSLSLATRESIRVLGSALKAARLDRRMTQAELAERLGTSRFTVMAIERGDPKVGVGTVFEAAAIVGLPLVASDDRMLREQARRTHALLGLLPTRVGRKPVVTDDDF